THREANRSLDLPDDRKKAIVPEDLCRRCGALSDQANGGAVVAVYVQRWLGVFGELHSARARFSDSKRKRQGSIGTGHHEVSGVEAAVLAAWGSVPSRLFAPRTSGNWQDIAGFSTLCSLCVIGVLREPDGIQRSQPDGCGQADSRQRRSAICG